MQSHILGMCLWVSLIYCQGDSVYSFLNFGAIGTTHLTWILSFFRGLGFYLLKTERKIEEEIIP